MSRYHCGVCGYVCESEAGIRDHIAERDADGDTHDGEPWGCTEDEIVVAWRLSTRHPWSLHGSWGFENDIDFAADESIGWAVRQHLRSGAHEVRVLYRRDAEHLCDIEPGDASIGGPLLK